MPRNAAIVGGGHADWGKRAATWKDLAQEAGKATFDDVDGLGPDDVEGCSSARSSPSASRSRATSRRSRRNCSAST